MKKESVYKCMCNNSPSGVYYFLLSKPCQYSLPGMAPYINKTYNKHFTLSPTIIHYLLFDTEVLQGFFY